MIRVEGLTKDYGPRRAIDGLTFDAEKGDILGFLGPNGAGKTTTMRILCGYMPPTFGKAEVAGFDVIDQSLEVRRLVGYMPETVPLYPDMTVFEYLKFMADLHRVAEGEDRVDELLEMRPVGMSLEDIFLELTRDEPSPPEPAGDEYLEEEYFDDIDVESSEDDEEYS